MEAMDFVWERCSFDEENKDAQKKEDKKI